MEDAEGKISDDGMTITIISGIDDNGEPIEFKCIDEGYTPVEVEDVDNLYYGCYYTSENSGDYICFTENIYRFIDSVGNWGTSKQSTLEYLGITVTSDKKIERNGIEYTLIESFK